MSTVGLAQEQRQNLQELKTQTTLLNLHLYLITYSNAWHAYGGQLAQSTSEEVGKERAGFPAIGAGNIVLYQEVSSSSGGLGKAALFYCGIHWAFHITTHILHHAST